MQIHTLDLHAHNLPQTIAAFLVVHQGEPVLVETGPGSTLNTLKDRLESHGFTPPDIKHVLVTHIHFDHAGAAGWWAQQGAQVHVHHVGARHLVDPSRLIASAKRIYGDQMEPLWGEILPAPEERVIPVYDGDEIRVAGLNFVALDTPGHARHHHVYRLGEFAFAGDAAGVRLPQSPFLDVPAPPPEFELEKWLHTLDRLLAENFSAIYLTHFDRLETVRNHLEQLKRLLVEITEFIGAQMQAGRDRDEIVRQYEDWCRQRARSVGISEELMQQYEAANPLYMSVDGILRYWRTHSR